MSRLPSRLICPADATAIDAARKTLMRTIVLDETCGKPWGKLRLLTSARTAQGSRSKGLDHLVVNLGVLGCPSLRRALAAAALSLATLAPAGYRQRRRHAGQGAKAGRRRAVLLRDRRPGDLLVDASNGADPGMYSVNRTARSTARPPSRSIRSPTSTPGPTAPTSSPSRCSSRVITIPLRPA